MLLDGWRASLPEIAGCPLSGLLAASLCRRIGLRIDATRCLIYTTASGPRRARQAAHPLWKGSRGRGPGDQVGARHQLGGHPVRMVAVRCPSPVRGRPEDLGTPLLPSSVGTQTRGGAAGSAPNRISCGDRRFGEAVASRLVGTTNPHACATSVHRQCRAGLASRPSKSCSVTTAVDRPATSTCTTTWDTPGSGEDRIATGRRQGYRTDAMESGMKAAEAGIGIDGTTSAAGQNGPGGLRGEDVGIGTGTPPASAWTTST